MPPKTPSNPARVSRPAPTAARLKIALERLTTNTAHPSPRVTVSELCRLAEVSRNTLYRYHAPILARLRRHLPRKSARSKARSAAEYRRRENHALRERVSQLAALVDHYFAAYRETTTLVARKDRELAQLRRQLKSRPTLLRPDKHQDGIR